MVANCGQAEPDVDFRRVFLKKIMRATPPIVTDGATDPSLWDYRGCLDASKPCGMRLDYKANMGDSYKVCLEKAVSVGFSEGF